LLVIRRKNKMNDSYKKAFQNSLFEMSGSAHTPSVVMVKKKHIKRRNRMAAGEPCHNCDKDCGWFTPKRKLVLAILCFTIASIMGYIQYG